MHGGREERGVGEREEGGRERREREGKERSRREGEREKEWEHEFVRSNKFERARNVAANQTSFLLRERFGLTVGT